MSSRSRPSPEPPASFHVESLGCAKNQVDSELMIAALERAGWARAADADAASVVVVNTCGFISSAKKESIETGLALRARYPGKKIYMVGCLPQRYAEELRGSMPEIDGFLGNADPPGVAQGIVGLVGRPPGRTGAGTAGGRAAGTAGGSAAGRRRPRVWERTHLLSFPGSAYVKVAEGCSNRCTYCAIPLIRGDLTSRPRADILDEIRGLASRGIREVILIAQDLGSWGRDAEGGRQARAGHGLVDLLEGISAIRGDFRVRMLYIHPDRFPPGLLAAVKSDSRFLPYFDVPFQHASPRILSAMGRRADPRRNLDLVRGIREALPGAVVRSTFLVGFPGETEEDFELLRGFQRDAALDWLGVFTYSREEDTPAWSMGGRVPSAVASRRKTAVEQAQVPLTERALDRHVGARLEVLIEEPFQDGEFSLGRAYLQAPATSPVTVNHGAAIAITAVPTLSGWAFKNWTVVSGSASFASSTSASTTVTLTAGDAAIRANFANPGSAWMQTTMPGTKNWSSVTYGNGTFVAIASGTSDWAATSPDGISWTKRTLPSAQSWNSVAYGNGVFAAVVWSSGGSSNVAAWSADGEAWTQVTMPASRSWNSVTYGEHGFVAVPGSAQPWPLSELTKSNGGAISTDGKTWTPINLGSSQNWYSVCYGNGRYVAVAYNSSVAAWSDNGTDWTVCSLLNNRYWTSVTCGNGTFVAVAGGPGGATNKAATSTDGITWTSRTMSTSSNWQSVAYGNGYFVATSWNSTTVAATSPDGITWTTCAMPSAQVWESVTWAGGVFVAVAYGSGVAATSPPR